MSNKFPLKIPLSATWQAPQRHADVFQCLPHGTQTLGRHQCGRRNVTNTVASQVHTDICSAVFVQHTMCGIPALQEYRQNLT